MLVHDFETIVNDDEVEIVAEVLGGVKFAYPYVKASLEKGKSVVTSNKELVAKYGAELLAIAKEKNVNFFFEASVGGGIPIIRPLNECLTAEEICEITGILNGTTNYILTKMSKEDLDFGTVLKMHRIKAMRSAILRQTLKAMMHAERLRFLHHLHLVSRLILKIFIQRVLHQLHRQILSLQQASDVQSSFLLQASA